MRYSHLKTYDIPHYFIDRWTGKTVGFAPEVWAKMTSLVGQTPDVQIITVIRGSKTEERIVDAIQEFGLKKSVDLAEKMDDKS